ncbi:hypothetical protein X474_07860 [Dethiosulfatarculus sandiegensis]|uniref:Uncharacterized protein n=1 Tax=Dethiosulfatarculus sandiegensis TaxID=1429043 RepID=A0A0D2GIJ3_9BACT|nr:hypothetical protein X474_07860 [Dethiosulfatarculus sandiegensis]
MFFLLKGQLDRARFVNRRRFFTSPVKARPVKPATDYEQGEFKNEANLSAQQHQKAQNSWLSCPQPQQKRKSGYSPP